MSQTKERFIVVQDAFNGSRQVFKISVYGAQTYYEIFNKNSKKWEELCLEDLGADEEPCRYRSAQSFISVLIQIAFGKSAHNFFESEEEAFKEANIVFS